MDQEDLKTALKKLADNHWKEKQAPMLLSDVAPALKNSVRMDYRPLLAGKSLKAFIKDTGESGGYHLIEHPTQTAKIALAPRAEKFEFPTEVVEKNVRKPAPNRKPENKALVLLDILATLPEEELAKISIPVSTLVKLIK